MHDWGRPNQRVLYVDLLVAPMPEPFEPSILRYGKRADTSAFWSTYLIDFVAMAANLGDKRRPWEAQVPVNDPLHIDEGAFPRYRGQDRS